MIGWSAFLEEVQKLAFTTSSYSAALNPSIPSQASHLPGYRAPQLRAAIQKTAAGAPTRGNFMMASDIPPFRAPRLDVAIQKEGDMLPDGVTYDPSDFRPANLMKKRADVSPAVPLGSGGGNPHRAASDIPPFRPPRLDVAIQKTSAATTPAGRLASAKRVGLPKLTAPPGPSIADVAKPRGKGFGIGIPGALKTTL